MGVPAFFRWLTIRYPQVVIDALRPEDMEDLMAQFKRERRGQDPNELDLGTA
jgi:5'-3' exonuclease|tara:strand:- start:444 stop:599 length:156 start_codon:yes stop_codon:yes gene_type:complete